MDLDTGDWEVLHASDSESVEELKSLDVIEGDSGGAIRSDYFSLDSEIYYSRIGDVTDEASVESNNPSWIDPASDTRSPRNDFPEFWPDSGSDHSDDRKYGVFEVNNELGFTENEDNQILVATFGKVVSSNGVVVGSQDSGKVLSDSSGFRGFEENIEKDFADDGLEVSCGQEGAVVAKEGDEHGDVMIGATKSSEGEKRVMVWWRLPLEILKYCVFRINPVWTVPMAAAMMGFVILGRHYYRMKKKSKSTLLKVTVDGQKVSQFTSRVAQLNEAFSVVRRVPVIRAQLPAPGVMPWPVMSR